MNLERKFTKKRGLIGYNEKDVRNNIQSLQVKHRKELEELKQKIEAEKERNQLLKTELDAIENQSIKNSIEEEVTKELITLFTKHNEGILKLKADLEEKERVQLEQLEQKIKQKEMAQESIKDVLEFLNNQKNQLKKELIK